MVKNKGNLERHLKQYEEKEATEVMVEQTEKEVKIRESQVLKDIIVTLYDEYNEEAMIVRHNTGGCKRGNSYIQFHSGGKGWPDVVMYFPYTCVMIEAKSPTGKQSKEQKEFQLRCEERGIPYLLVDTAEGLIGRIEGVIYEKRSSWEETFN